MARGAALAADGNARAVGVLSQAARGSLEVLAAQGGQRLLSAAPEAMPMGGAAREATQRAARAHLALGEAADRFAQRDLAITALARAYRLAGPNRNDTNTLSRAVTLALGAALRDGMPHVAADDTLDTLSSLALWKPRRFSFSLPPGALGPSLSSGPSTSEATPRIELLITQGKVFPPESMTSKSSKAVVAPLYRGVSEQSLPDVLRLGYMVAGYQKAALGPNQGMWELEARVFYAHPVFTRQNRDDRPRAESLCAQFLRVRALSRAALGLENPYHRLGSPPGATDLWLNEVSALWPSDDDDPETEEARGARMPKVNTLSPIARAAEVAETPLSMPWLAAGQMIGAPGDILFFKSGQPRGEAEWLREVAHEYGHVALPPAGVFRAPLEPFGNGQIGEALSMMWVAAAPRSFDATQFLPAPLPGTLAGAAEGMAGASAFVGAARGTANPRGTGNSRAGAPIDPSPGGLHASALRHVARESVPALRLWSAQGPGSTLRREAGEGGLQYLLGFSVWAERVYGAAWLGAAMRPSLSRSALSWKRNGRILPTTGHALLSDWEAAVSLGLKRGGRMAVWLPGALESLPQSVPATQIVNRAPLSLRLGDRFATRLFVPLNAKVLHLEVRGPRSGAAVEALRVEGWQARAAGANAIEITLAGRRGWQRFVLAARSPLSLGAAWLSK